MHVLVAFEKNVSFSLNFSSVGHLFLRNLHKLQKETHIVHLKKRKTPFFWMTLISTGTQTRGMKPDILEMTQLSPITSSCLTITVNEIRCFPAFLSQTGQETPHVNSKNGFGGGLETVLIKFLKTEFKIQANQIIKSRKNKFI